MIRRTIQTGLFSIAALAMTATFAAAQSHTSKPFSGAKVNAGTVTHSTKDGKDVVKVQIYCAWAEAVLGEAPFSAPLMTMNK